MMGWHNVVLYATFWWRVCACAVLGRTGGLLCRLRRPAVRKQVKI